MVVIAMGAFRTRTMATGKLATASPLTQECAPMCIAPLPLLAKDRSGSWP